MLQPTQSFWRLAGIFTKGARAQVDSACRFRLVEAGAKLRFSSLRAPEGGSAGCMSAWCLQSICAKDECDRSSSRDDGRGLALQLAGTWGTRGRSASLEGRAASGCVGQIHRHFPGRPFRGARTTTSKIHRFRGAGARHRKLAERIRRDKFDPLMNFAAPELEVGLFTSCDCVSQLSDPERSSGRLGINGTARPQMEIGPIWPGWGSSRRRGAAAKSSTTRLT